MCNFKYHILFSTNSAHYNFTFSIVVITSIKMHLHWSIKQNSNLKEWPHIAVFVIIPNIPTFRILACQIMGILLSCTFSLLPTLYKEINKTVLTKAFLVKGSKRHSNFLYIIFKKILWTEIQEIIHTRKWKYPAYSIKIEIRQPERTHKKYLTCLMRVLPLS